jgi:hypothetical protein
MQILILGMHRSGTSATARLINMMGAYFGPETMAMGGQPENPKGFWERFDVLHANKELMKTQQCDWDMLKNWHPEKAAHIPDVMRPFMQKIIAELDSQPNWLIKDPRLCLTLPAWLSLLQKPLALIVYRNPLEIAVSLAKRNMFPNVYSIALWEYYAVNLLNASMNIPRVYMRHEDMIHDPIQACRQVLAQCIAHGVTGMSMPAPHAIEEFIDKRLYRSTIDMASATILSPEQLHLCDILQGKLQQNEQIQVSNTSLNILKDAL